MNLVKTTDLGVIKSVLFNPVIFDSITEDGSPPKDQIEFDTLETDYYAGYVEDQIVGLMIYHHNNGLPTCHVQVLPEHRAKHAREFGRLALDVGLSQFGTVYAEIPDCFPNVLKFAQSFGFEVYETTDGGCVRNGKTYNVHKLRCSNGVL